MTITGRLWALAVFTFLPRFDLVQPVHDGEGKSLWLKILDSRFGGLEKNLEKNLKGLSRTEFTKSIQSYVLKTLAQWFNKN